ncbi:hypothetical protein [Parasitella parasitica]|uniref:Uncharacterized protein n=1 Tax=Parasitella parasitica TaxID=35722 RepID=A0A0B7N3C8_9FUNG|nr:hypothetical protein [Parasitella parasitica]
MLVRLRPKCPQRSSQFNDCPKGHGATRYEVGPLPARFDRPDPGKPTFGISKPEQLQAAVVSLDDQEYQHQQQKVTGISQSPEAVSSSSHPAAAYCWLISKS